MSIKWGDIDFNGPNLITNWDPPYCAAVYAIMMKPYPKNKPRTYRILYFGESGNLSDRGFYKSHHKYECWIKYADSEQNLYIGVYLMHKSTDDERRKVESELINQYSSHCY